MNRMEFLAELEKLLIDIPQNEREEALQYYRDYLDDAGSEHDEEAIKALGTPADIAATIKKDLGQESTEKKAATSGETTLPEKIETVEKKEETKTDNNTLLIVLLVVLSPVWVPLALAAAGTVFGLLFSVVCVIFSLFIAFAVVAVSLMFAGVVLFAIGIVKLFVLPFGGICLIGAGLLLAGIGLVFMVLTIWLAGDAIPTIFKGIGKIFSNIFKKKEGCAA